MYKHKHDNNCTNLGHGSSAQKCFFPKMTLSTY